ncbi:FlgD immunoglobulin-like domain containing protein [Candidatus Eisenbacteria bacterium]|uniref:FlgD immunoglobulin-like domain containing protein n=1 Tax=Eiseniibacteriota bacterium TaxID=2212470 RepID=A0ABV6YK15_UNCEI
MKSICGPTSCERRPTAHTWIRVVIALMTIAWPGIAGAYSAFPTTPGDDIVSNSNALFRVTLAPDYGGASLLVKVSGSACIIRSAGHSQSTDPSGPLGAGACGLVLPTVTDSMIAVFPRGFNSGNGDDEVHTMMADMSLSNGDGWGVLAGLSASADCPLLPPSYGEVEARGGASGFGGPGADSFFNLHIQVDVPPSVYPGGLHLYNPTPLVVEAKRLRRFPPIGRAYIHSFDFSGTVELWDCATGCFVGWLKQGTHGVQDPDNPDPPTPVLWNPPYRYPVVFSLNANAEGIVVPNACVPQPNDVYALGLAGVGNMPPSQGYTTQGELFQSSGATLGGGADNTNIDRMSAALGIGTTPGLVGCAGTPPPPPPFMGPFSPNTIPAAGDPCPAPPTGPGALGLTPGDNINSLSYGRDMGNILLFSVGPAATGVPGSAVRFQSTLSPPALPVTAAGAVPSNAGGAPGREAAGDIFNSPVIFPPPPPIVGIFGAGPPTAAVPAPPGLNTLALDELLLGLQAPATAFSVLGIPEDDLDALEIGPMSRVDDDIDGRIDVNRFVFFTLTPGSPSLPGSGLSARDILVATNGPPFGFVLYASGVANIGLHATDVIDALVLHDSSVGGPPDGILGFGDEALFSLAAGSGTLTGLNPNYPGGGSPGDVFYTSFPGVGGPIVLYAAAATIGLLNTDELNALEIGLTGDCQHLDCGSLEFPDEDGEGWWDGLDNCVGVYNPGVIPPLAEYRLEQPDWNGDGSGCEEASGLPEGGIVPTRDLLFGPMPNPQADKTRLEFMLPDPQAIRLEVFDERGRLVRVLAEGHHSEGHHIAIWDGRNAEDQPVRSGVYWVRLAVGDEIFSRRVTIIR